MNYSHSDLIVEGIWFILMIVLCGLMLIVGQVLLGVAVYHNAKAYWPPAILRVTA